MSLISESARVLANHNRELPQTCSNLPDILFEGVAYSAGVVMQCEPCGPVLLLV
jgi:hypothetical protein